MGNLAVIVVYIVYSGILYILITKGWLKIKADKSHWLRKLLMPYGLSDVILYAQVFFLVIFIPYVPLLLLSNVYPVLSQPLHTSAFIGGLSVTLTFLFVHIIKGASYSRKHS